jgi:hypothetical protein
MIIVLRLKDFYKVIVTELQQQLVRKIKDGS